MAAWRNYSYNQPYYNQTQESPQQANDITVRIDYMTRNLPQQFQITSSVNHGFGMQQVVSNGMHTRPPLPHIDLESGTMQHFEHAGFYRPPAPAPLLEVDCYNSTNHSLAMHQVASNELQTLPPFPNTDLRSGATQYFERAESYPPPAPVPLMETDCNASVFSGANQKKATVDKDRAARGAAKSPHNRCRSGSTSSIPSNASTLGSQQPKHRASISEEKMKRKRSNKFWRKNKDTKGCHATGKSSATSNCDQVYSKESPNCSAVSNLDRSISDSQAMCFSTSCSTVTNNSSVQSRERNKKGNKRSSYQKSDSESSKTKSGSDVAEKDMKTVSSSRNNESKVSVVEIVFNRIKKLAKVESYLERILSKESFNFSIETAQSDASSTKYIVKFASLSQAKKAVKIWHNLRKGEKSEATDIVFRLITTKETEDNKMLKKCKREIKQKVTDYSPPALLSRMEIDCNASAFSNVNQKKATVDKDRATRGAAKSPHNRCRGGSTSSIANDASTLGSQQPEHGASISEEKMKRKRSNKSLKKNKETKGGHVIRKSSTTCKGDQVHSKESPNFSAVSNLNDSNSDGQEMSSTSCSTLRSNTSVQSRQRNRIRNKRSSYQKSDSDSLKTKCGSYVADKDKNTVSSLQNNESKISEVEIVFNRITEPVTVECYLEHILSGESFNFSMETAQSDSSSTKYIVKFVSLMQAKKAVKILRKLNKGEGSEATDMACRLIRNKQRTQNKVIEKCTREIKQKAADLITAHGKKIKEIEKRLQNLPKSKKGKGMPLKLFWDVKPKKEALSSKKSELERQKKEFEMFLNSFQNKIEALKEDTEPELTENLKKLRTSFGRERQRFEMALPIYARKSEIIEAVRETQVCVILAETGSGKSTQITQYLYEEGYAEKGIIVCTQPRKVAATSLSNYVASQMGSRPGQLVSSIVGARGRTTDKTAILYMTDHALLNECLRDPDLTKYSCVIVDEAHERSIFTDLLLGMIKKALSKRADLRVIITSATIDPDLFLKYFRGCQKLEVSGRMFPVEVFWKEKKSGESSFVNDAVEKACEVHETEGRGDVLVFLTSAAEIQKACDMMSSKPKGEEFECLPLHGKLHPEDQQKVFQQTPGKRKIIFATNCAETSVTIPGIKFVIDSGMVKEMNYDAKRNMNSLNIQSINKSSAQQRRGRAGRLEAGKCFRLYSEEDYQKMDDRSTPEILRVHLGQAILKLMELGIDPTVFDFVESPPIESLMSACESLISLGAVLDGCLTDLGRKMARLPIDPRLAKLLIVGVDEGVGKDAMILASVATVNGNIFFRMGTEEEKRQHDMKKIRFCHSGGDLLTLLSVYQKWQQLPSKDKRVRNKWCYDNSLNAKAMHMADETIKDLTLILRQDLQISNLERVSSSTEQVPKNETESTDENNTKLRKIIMACYAQNLCMYTGNERAGYRVTSNDCVQLHPSSSLKYLDQPPQFVVYEQLMKTTKDYILNITPVEEEWVEEYALRGLLPNLSVEELEKLKSDVLVPNSLTCSKELMQCAVGLGFKGKTLRTELEEEVSRICDGALNVIETNPDKGNVKIYVAQQHKRDSLEVVERRLETYRKRFRSCTVEKPLNEDSNDVRVILGRGGVVQHVLMPNMYRSVVVSHILEDLSLENILNFLGTDDDILEHNVWYKKEMMHVNVLFRDPDQAMQTVLLASVPDCGFVVRPSLPIKRSLHPTTLKVKVAWTRRQSKGMASFNFKNSEDFITASCKLDGKYEAELSAFFSIDENRPESIFVRGLGPNIFEEDLIAFVEERLNESQPHFAKSYPNFGKDGSDEEDERLGKDDDGSRKQKIEIESLFIIREKSYESSEEDYENMKVHLTSAVEKIAPNARFEVKLIKPKPCHLLWIAYLEFVDATEGYRVVRKLNGRPVKEYSLRCNYRVTPELHCTLTCLKNAYMATEQILHKLQRSIADKCSRKCARSVQFEAKVNENIVLLELSAECFKHYVCLRNALSDVLRGDKLDCKESKDLEVLLTKQGNEFLNTVERETKAAIQRDWRTSCLFIYGSDAVKTRAKTVINDFLDDIVTHRSCLWEVNLRDDDKPRGFIKAIIKRFGPTLEHLQAIDGVRKVSLNLRNHVLWIQSTPEAKAIVEEQIGACIAALPCPPKNEPQFPIEECPVCLSEPEGKCYRLVCCGHAYCEDCITSQMQALELPLKCAVENCQEEFVWKDLELLLNQKEMGRLMNEALKNYVASHQEQVKYCPTPNCYMVYRVTEDGQRFSCSACGTATCTSCHIEYHVGMTCSMYQSEKRDGGVENLKNWMKEDKKNRKRCPKCNVFIEKHGGCNHMKCKSCREHFCWLCLARCGSENGFYVHQRICPERQQL